MCGSLGPEHCGVYLFKKSFLMHFLDRLLCIRMCACITGLAHPSQASSRRSGENNLLALGVKGHAKDLALPVKAPDTFLCVRACLCPCTHACVCMFCWTFPGAAHVFFRDEISQWPWAYQFAYADWPESPRDLPVSAS